MATTKFKVVSATGVSIAGIQRKAGDEFTAESKSAHVKTALHFKQIEAVSDIGEASAGEGAGKPAAGKKKAKKDEKEDPAGDGKAPENPPTQEPTDGAGGADPATGEGASPAAE